MAIRWLSKGIFLCSLLLPSFSGHANHVRCECPNVDARATGSSSCSASESGGRCTVAFNEFDVSLEKQAKEFLGKWTNLDDLFFMDFPEIPGSIDERGFTVSRAQWLLTQSPVGLIDQLMIYALVASTQDGSYAGDGLSVARLHQGLRKNASALGRVFVFGNNVIQNEFFRMGHGCFEFRLDGVWSMYKSEWSDVIEKRQC